MKNEDILKITKVLSNSTRLDILNWLKKAEDNFPPHQDLGHFDDGVCGQYIINKTKLAQPTISSYLSQMCEAGLLIATRHGKWTYYKRNEDNIKAFTEKLKDDL